MDYIGGNIDPEEKFERTEEYDLSEGPIKNRACTDTCCLGAWGMVQVVFFIIMVVQQGKPNKLYMPRDFSGAYCGVETNWNDGRSMEEHLKLSFTVNMSNIVDPIMEELICSYVAEDNLRDIFVGNHSSKMDEYLCACCKVPCGSCTRAHDSGINITDDNVESIVGRMTSAFMGDPNLTEIYSFGGAFEGRFSSQSFWETTSHLNRVCLADCSIPTSKSTRNYAYRPSQDSKFFTYWNELMDSNYSNPILKETMTSKFTFPALDFASCPYPEERCVVFPGLEIKKGSADYCSLEMEPEVVSVLGETTSKMLMGFAEHNFNLSGPTLGDVFGNILRVIDVIIMVCFIAFVSGLTYLLTMRYVAAFAVWVGAYLALSSFFIVGGLMIFNSHRCKGEAVINSNMFSSVTGSGSNSLVEFTSEELKGDRGSGYRGYQTHTKDGYECAEWASQTAFPQYTPENYPDSDLTGSYCRNPFHESAANKPGTIWCVTKDSEQLWGECLPYGVTTSQCESGYVIDRESGRDVMFGCGIFVVICGMIFFVTFIFLRNRINMAIILNKVACKFITFNPSSMAVPNVQSLVIAGWILLWLYCVACLMADVADDAVPTKAFATYAEAYGSYPDCGLFDFEDGCATTPGKCTSGWLASGSVWKDTECTTGDQGVAECWRCSPPRYTISGQLVYSILPFLWNNAFIIALGQTIIAASVSIWFFAFRPRGAKILFDGVKTVFQYHLGTVALGSFLVAFTSLFRWVGRKIEAQAAVKRNKVHRIIRQVIDNILWYFETFLKFLNRKAYIHTAIMGTNFFVSSKNSFYVIWRNAGRFGVLFTISSLLQSVGIVSIATISTFLGYLILGAQHPDVSNTVPLLIVFVVSAYLIGSVYTSVHGLAVDTSLQCFIVAEEMGLSEMDFKSSAFKLLSKHMYSVEQEEKERQREETLLDYKGDDEDSEVSSEAMSEAVSKASRASSSRKASKVSRASSRASSKASSIDRE